MEGSHPLDSLDREESLNSCMHDVGGNKKSTHSCPKINENASGVGALRYAIHLRFLCPSPKNNSVRRCKSTPLSVPQETSLDREAERRFYLYNDLRVVFPQRHSDADEGKVYDMKFT